MTDHPFSIFEPFKERIDIRFFTREDNLKTDQDLAKKLGNYHIASLWQAHGCDAVIVREPTSRMLKADAITTDKNDLWLSIRAADCQQLIVYAPNQHVCAVVHSGWKGLRAGIIASCFRALKQEWNIDPADTYVGIGPSLCTDCAEFTDPVTELEGLAPKFFSGRNADLRGIADAQLNEIGVPVPQRERSPDCTKCNADTYWSYRGEDREQVKQGLCNVIACRLK
jgi:YfiH family protein